MRDFLLNAYAMHMELLRSWSMLTEADRRVMLPRVLGTVLAAEYSVSRYDLRDAFHAGSIALGALESMLEELMQQKSRYREQLRAGASSSRIYQASCVVDGEITRALEARDRLGEVVSGWREELARVLPEEEWALDGEIIVELSRVAS